MRWLFVGAGNMASSLIGGLLGGGTDASHIAVVDTDESACQRAEKAFNVLSAQRIDDIMTPLFTGADDNPRLLGVVIAVKPHIVETVCRSFEHYLATTGSSTGKPTDDNDAHVAITPVFISVAAGVRESSMRNWLPEGSALVRCMPNTPALLGLGVTALFANEQCSSTDKALAETLLNSAGTTLWVEKESALDAVTAVSGSGPAYFFYLIEHMIDAGASMGLPRDTAETLAIETAFGAASMARQRHHSPAVLRHNVTSKGGTTAAALQVFNERKTPEIIHAALQASHERAVKLGDDFAS